MYLYVFIEKQTPTVISTVDLISYEPEEHGPKLNDLMTSVIEILSWKLSSISTAGDCMTMLAINSCIIEAIYSCEKLCKALVCITHLCDAIRKNVYIIILKSD